MMVDRPQPFGVDQLPQGATLCLPLPLVNFVSILMTLT
jgi:hypothetical protein